MDFEVTVHPFLFSICSWSWIAILRCNNVLTVQDPRKRELRKREVLPARQQQMRNPMNWFHGGADIRIINSFVIVSFLYCSVCPDLSNLPAQAFTKWTRSLLCMLRHEKRAAASDQAAFLHFPPKVGETNLYVFRITTSVVSLALRPIRGWVSSDEYTGR